MKKIYKFEWDEADEMSVVISVDTDVLSLELAHEINKYMSGHASRLSECNGDAYRVVAQLFAHYFMRWAFENGGIFCTGHDTRAPEYIRDVLTWVGEGWPEYEQCGLDILSGYVNCPDFSTMSVTVMQS